MEDIEFERMLEWAMQSEGYCKMYLTALEARGVVFSKPIESMTHEQARDAIRAIIGELSAREALPTLH